VTDDLGAAAERLRLKWDRWFFDERTASLPNEGRRQGARRGLD
jgi:hypothetical protein